MVFRHFDRFGRNACIQRIDRRPPDDRNTPARTCSRRLRTHDQRSGPLSSSPDDRELSHQESGATAAPRPPFFATSKADLADEFRLISVRRGMVMFPGLRRREPRNPTLNVSGIRDVSPFEPVWGFSCQVVFWVVVGSLFGGVSR